MSRWNKRPDETAEQYLLRIGQAKINKEYNGTWDNVATLLNQELSPEVPKTESSWRHKIQSRLESFHNEPVRVLNNYTERIEEPDDDDALTKLLVVKGQIEIEKQMLHEERQALNRLKRSEIRKNSIIDIFREEVKRVDPIKYNRTVQYSNKENALYVLLSDLHYGIAFNNRCGRYDSEIAADRLEIYAARICELAEKNDVDTVYISLMGDMISGKNHMSIRIENREDVVRQVMGSSELVSKFIYQIHEVVPNIYINSVPGNHSRIDEDADSALSGEKLDTLIFWYCKSKFEHDTNVHFVENEIDDTIGDFDIFGKTYISVHGDFDKDIHTTARKVSEVLGREIYGMCSGHMHVAATRFEDIAYIQNGSVCGSGDDYTLKKRLYGYAIQVVMLCDENGIKEVHPINLEEA